MAVVTDVIQIKCSPETRKKLAEKAKAHGFSSVQKFLLFMGENGKAKIEVK